MPRRATDAADAAVRQWYGAEPFSQRWMREPVPGWPRRCKRPGGSAATAKSESSAQDRAALANIEKLRAGARAVVTGQQVVLFGGPLLTILKAATAVARAKQATAASGVEHVPVFWMATEDHDLAEVDQVSLSDQELRWRRCGLGCA